MSPPRPFPKKAHPKSLAMSGLRDRPLDFILEMADQFGDLVHFESRQDRCKNQRPFLQFELKSPRYRPLSLSSDSVHG